jgi:hypothetical protein
MSSEGIVLGAPVSIDFVLGNGDAGQESRTHRITVDTQRQIDINAVSTEAAQSNTSFGYSGRHDHGSLPQLRSSSRYIGTLSAVIEAKRECDDFLTAMMKAESQQLPEKKARLIDESEEMES